MQKKSWALITGASSGIGEATAKKLAQEGYNLILLARREERLKVLAREIQTLWPKLGVEIWALDITNFALLKETILTHQALLNNLTVLINNAGLAKGTEAIQEGAIEDWESMIDTNIKGLLYLTRWVVPFLIKNPQPGHIINLGSVAGRWVYPGGAVYCATKHAVRAFSEGLRQDLCGTKIRVSVIEPGMVETEFSQVRLGNEELAKAVYKGMTPLTPQDIAETICWCLSRPPHVNIQELILYPTDQAAIRQIHRTNDPRQ